MSVRNVVKSIQDIMRQDVGVDGDAQRISQLCWMFFLKIIDDQDQELELMQQGYRSPIPAKFRWRAWAADPEGITGEALLAFVNDELFPALKELPNTARDGRRRVVRDVFEDAYNYMKSGQLMPVAKALMSGESKIATSGMPMPAAWAWRRAVSTSQSSVDVAGDSITRAPVMRFAVHLEMASEINDPPMPMTAAKIRSDPRFSPCWVR